ANESKEIMADMCLRLHATRGRDDDIRDGTDERTKKVNFRTLPDTGGAVFGQNDAQRHVALEPALAAVGPDDSGDQHGHDNKDEHTGDFVDAAKLEPLFFWFVMMQRI